MTLGLDIGTMNLAAAYEAPADDEEGEPGLETRRVRDAFLALDPSEHLDANFSEEFLKRSGAQYIKMDEGDGEIIYILGDDALEFANMMSEELQRPMAEGVLNPDEPKRKAMLEALIDGIAGDLTDHEVVYSSPASPINDSYDVQYHEQVIGDILEDIGFDDPTAMTESMAIVLEEFPDTYSGLGLSMGAGMANVSLAWRGMPVLEFSMQKCGDWIDKGVAEKLNEVPNVITQVKEDGGFDVSFDRNDLDDPVHQAISVYYDILVENLIDGVNHLWENTPDSELPNIADSIPIVMAGGTSKADGMIPLMNQTIEQKGLPFEVESIERAEGALFTPAKGLLRAADVE